MLNFNFQNPTKINFGPAEIQTISKEIPLDARVLIVYGGGSIKGNGVYQQVIDALKNILTLNFQVLNLTPPTIL